MNFLDYLQLYNKPETAPEGGKFSIALVTNFTDDVLAKVFLGVCRHHGIAADLTRAPYKQYAFLLKDRSGQLWQNPKSLTFFLFDFNFFLHSEFSANDEFGEQLLADLSAYAEAVTGTIVINSFLLPYWGPRLSQSLSAGLFARAEKLNDRLRRLALEHPNVQIYDLNRLAHYFGQQNIRDLRGMYAFDIPFTNDFFASLAEEWFVYVRALAGKSKKVIVLDLDNTLWGGVVGELGPLGILLGPGYPGLAFQNFQRALLAYQHAGVLLAINSKNNLADVEEVFEKNSNMILKRDDFAVIVANWEDKVTNFRTIAKQLNLGLDSMIFFDDDPVQREMVKTQLPEVLVPEFSLPPEEYAKVSFGLAVFSPFAATAEDLAKNQQYGQEQERQRLQSSVADISGFIGQLGMNMGVAINSRAHLPRLSQLTLKTNQCNATTRRYSEKEMAALMEKGWVFDDSLTDKFGDYGLTAMAIVLPEDGNAARLDNFLMSCRVLGRGVEFVFLDFIVRWLQADQKVAVLSAEFTPTAKNAPAKDFFADFGFSETAVTGEGIKKYELDCAAYVARKNPKVHQTIIIKQI